MRADGFGRFNHFLFRGIFTSVDNIFPGWYRKTGKVPVERPDPVYGVIPG